MNQLVNGVLVVLTAIIGLAILSVILSKQSNTVGVLKAGQNAFSGALGTALSPIVSASSFSGMNGYNPTF